MHVLVCLAEHPGQVVLRGDLIRTVWPGMDVLEKVLTRTISDLRTVLGDDPRAPHIVETIYKTGYRLLLPVAPAEGAPEETIPCRRPVLRAPVPVLMLASLLLAGAGLLWVLRDPQRSSPRYAAWSTRPLTADVGPELYPALSPDGSRVAFAWPGGERGTLDIYVKQLRSESLLRLTDDPANEIFPAWSPDACSIAYLRQTPEEVSICVLPSIGGEVHRLFRTSSLVLGLDWAPDGSSLAFSAPVMRGGAAGIQLLDLETLEVRPWVKPPLAGGGDTSPVFSPDGKSIAFVRADRAMEEDIYLAPAEGGDARRLTVAQHRIAGLDWLPGGREIVYAATPVGAFNLWRVSVAGGTPQWLPVTSSCALHPTVPDCQGSLVYAQMSFECGIYAMEITGDGRVRPREEPLIASTRMDHLPVCSPDGHCIAFVSDRSGHREIWVCDADGSHPQRLTDLSSPDVLNPTWSPDGQRMAFSAICEGYLAVFVMDLDALSPRRLSGEAHHEIVRLWSREDDWIYFEADVGGEWQIWRMKPGGQERQRITEVGFQVVQETTSRDTLLCYDRRESGLWHLSLADRNVRCILRPEEMRGWVEYAVAENGVFFVRHMGGRSILGFHDLASGRADSLAEVLIPLANLTVTPDGSMLLYDGTRRVESDLILAEELE